MGNQQKDNERTEFLEREGFQVIRIWDHEVLSDFEGSLEYIRKHIGKSPDPSPLEGRELKQDATHESP